MEIKLLEKYLKDSNLTITELVNRNVLANITQAMRAYAYMQVSEAAVKYAEKEKIEKEEKQKLDATKKTKSCFWGHSWEKWEYDNGAHPIQTRYCSRCGKIQRKYL
jgi:hypothetical protein